MEFFRIQRDIPFMRHALIFNVISIITFLIAVGALAFRGLHLGVDFTGGTVMELKKSDATVALQRVEFVGPQVGRELLENGALALLFVSIGIVLYLWLRFEWKFGVAAIIANLHDVVIILGFFALFQWEFSLPVLAAVLAVLGYSVNESVVVFDRVREVCRNRRFRTHSVPQVLDHAITAKM